MADITRDSFNFAKRFAKIIFQRSRDVLDFELNELQDILRVFTARKDHQFNHQGVTDDALLVEGTGAVNDATVRAGTFWYHGMAYVIESDTTLSALGLTLTTPGANRVDYVYLQLQEGEVDAATDSSIAIAALGETQRRRKLNVTWGIAEGGAVPASSAETLSEGGIHYIPIARLTRSTGVATIGATDVLDLRPVAAVNRVQRDVNVLAGLSDAGFVSWELSTGTVTFSNGGSPPGGLVIRWPNGSNVTYVVGSDTLTAGQCLFINPRRFARGGSQFANVGGGSTQPLHEDVQKVNLADIDPESDYLIICANIGGDLFLGLGGGVLHGESGETTTSRSWRAKAQWVTKTVSLPLAAGMPQAPGTVIDRWRYGSTHTWRSTVDSGAIDIPWPPLPAGAKTVSVAATINPGTARATEGDRMLMTHLRVNASGSALVGGFTRDDGTSGAQTRTDTFAHTILSGNWYLTTITSGNDGGAHITDELEHIELTYKVCENF